MLMSAFKPERRILKRVILFFVILIALVGGYIGIRGLLLFRQVANHKAYWELRANEAIPLGALIYVALGDSAAQGIGASHPEKGYVGLVAKEIDERTGRPVHVFNLSVTGAKVEDVLNDQLSRLEQLRLKPDFITLEIGANGIKDFDEIVLRRDFAAILDQLPAHTVVADIPYFGGGRYRSREENSLTASAIIRELAVERGMPVARLHDITKERDSWRIYAADFFHPSDYGYEVWAQAFVAALEPQLTSR